jgi:hypothetical protein
MFFAAGRVRSPKVRVFVDAMVDLFGALERA